MKGKINDIIRDFLYILHVLIDSQYMLYLAILDFARIYEISQKKKFTRISNQNRARFPNRIHNADP